MAEAESQHLPRGPDSNMAFKEIPILDLSEGRSEETKPAFLVKLRDALLNTGFLYIKNTGIDQDLYDRVCEQGIKFFDIPEEEKLAIEMKHKPRCVVLSKMFQPSVTDQVSTASWDIASLGMRSLPTKRIGGSSWT